MIILKLGGSLLSKPILQEWLTLAAEQGKGQVVIVPGGGVFADQVRETQQQWHYNDAIAHQMAILAMHQMALLFQGLSAELVLIEKIENIRPTLQAHKVVVWLPLMAELNALNIPATWDVTSDSLAAYLGQELVAKQLILVKSAKIIDSDNMQQWTEKGLVDKALSATVNKLNIAVECLQSDQLPQFKQRLIHYA